MSDVECNLEAKVELLESRLREVTYELNNYKLIEHANCGCTNFCYEKENANNIREMYDDLINRYDLLKQENMELKEVIGRLRHGL